jgi:tRNA pseudouridine-54 N-methylase
MRVMIWPTRGHWNRTPSDFKVEVLLPELICSVSFDVIQHCLRYAVFISVNIREQLHVIFFFTLLILLFPEILDCTDSVFCNVGSSILSSVAL